MKLQKKDRGYISGIVIYFFMVFLFQFMAWGQPFFFRLGVGTVVATIITVVALGFYFLLEWSEKE